MFTFRMIVACIFLLLSLWIIIGNWYCFVLDAILRKKSPSWIPFLGAIFLIAFCFVLPYPIFRKWWWAAFILDYGSGLGVLYAIMWGIYIEPNIEYPRRDQLFDLIHDKFFDLDQIDFQEEAKQLTIPLSTDTNTNDELQFNDKLVFTGVMGIDIHDTEKVGVYDINKVEVDNQRHMISIVTNIPLLLEIKVENDWKIVFEAGFVKEDFVSSIVEISQEHKQQVEKLLELFNQFLAEKITLEHVISHWPDFCEQSMEIEMLDFFINPKSDECNDKDIIQLYKEALEENWTQARFRYKLNLFLDESREKNKLPQH